MSDNQKHKKFSLVTYNIHQGLTTKKKKLPFWVLKEALIDLKVDVALLQEVAGGKEDPHENPSQLQKLAENNWDFFVYQKNAIKKSSFHGNAVLSKFPIANTSFMNLSVRGFIKRGALHATLLLPGGSHLHLLGAHLGLLQFERLKQIKKILSYIDDEIPKGDPLILGGDFNDWQLSVGRLLIRRGFQEAYHFFEDKHAKTFPSLFPLLKLDRIYFRNLSLKEARVVKGKPWNLFSDHLPLIAEFKT